MLHLLSHSGGERPVIGAHAVVHPPTAGARVLSPPHLDVGDTGVYSWACQSFLCHLPAGAQGDRMANELYTQTIPSGIFDSRPYDLHSVQIKKSDDLDNACAKSRVLEALLAQAVAMQIISTPGFRRR